MLAIVFAAVKALPKRTLRSLRPGGEEQAAGAPEERAVGVRP